MAVKLNAANNILFYTLWAHMNWSYMRGNIDHDAVSPVTLDYSALSNSSH